MSNFQLPKRSPYLQHETMGRGAPFARHFRNFVESGGVAKHKHCVAMNIR